MDRPNTRCRPERRADELGQVGGHRDRLGLQPQQHHDADGSWSRQTSGRLRPVAMPSLALIDWTSMAIRFAASTTHSSVYPNCEPPAMLVAKLPGST